MCVSGERDVGEVSRVCVCVSGERVGSGWGEEWVGFLCCVRACVCACLRARVCHPLNILVAFPQGSTV